MIQEQTESQNVKNYAIKMSVIKVNAQTDASDILLIQEKQRNNHLSNDLDSSFINSDSETEQNELFNAETSLLCRECLN